MDWNDGEHIKKYAKHVSGNVEIKKHLSTNLQLVDILITRFKILGMRNGLTDLLEELYVAIFNWRSYYTKKKIKNKDGSTIKKDIKVTVLEKGKVMIDLC